MKPFSLVVLLLSAWPSYMSVDALAQVSGPEPRGCAAGKWACFNPIANGPPPVPSAAVDIAMSAMLAASVCGREQQGCTKEALTAEEQVLPDWPTRDHIDPDHYYRVVGVADDDVLNLRDGPGTEFQVMTELAPHAENIHVGDCQTNSRGEHWCAVLGQGLRGWANRKFLVQY